MKRILILLLAAALTGGLLGCSRPAQSEQKGFTTADAQTLMDAGVFNGDMTAIDTDVLSSLYDIDPSTIKEGVGYLAVNTSVSADELAILVLQDEEGAKAAETACEKRLDHQLRSYKDYAPVAVPRLEGAVIRREGNTVLLAVGDAAKLPSVVDQLGS